MNPGPIRLLVVEDNAADVRLVQEMLAEADAARFRIVHADLLAKGLKALSEQEIHVILLDLSLPDSFGLETLKGVRSAAPRLPIVVLSYHQDEALALQAVQMGAQDYLVKGEGNGDSLVRTIRYALERKQAEERLRENQEALRENHHLLRAVIDGTTDSVYVKDLQGRYLMMNSAGARLFGKLPEEIVGRRDIDLFPQETALQIIRDDRRILSAGETLTFEEIAAIGEGSRTFLSTKGPWRNYQGEVIGIIGISREITERKRAEESLRAHGRQQAALAELGQHALAGIDLYALLDKTAALVARALETEYCQILELLSDGKILLLRAGVGWREGLIRTATVAANAESHGGYTLQEKGPVVVEDFRTETRFASPTLLREHGAISGVSVVIPGAGRPFGTLAVHSTSRRSFTQGEIRFLEVVANILATALARRHAEEMIQHQAYYDMLTGLPNRALLENHLSLALSQADRHNGMVALMLLDLDRFKEINDTLGHLVGDQLLRAVSERLSACVREGDTFARMGGDEFTILLPEIETIDKVTLVAERVLAAFTDPFPIAGHLLRISASIGIALYPQSGCDREMLMRNADVALYRAKEEGRNTACFFSPDQGEKRNGRLSLESSLRQALEREEFFLHYQPQIDLKTGKLAGLETLLRWRRPDGKLIPPGEFIPLAEQIGLINPIWDWVLQASCAQAVAWQRAGFSPVRMAMNLSPAQFHREDLPEAVGRVLDETGLAPGELELELTEKMLMRREEAMMKTLRRLAALG
ncbi:MAG TPA: diguanylate cyclase, partial [Candidatus Manganitrophaceae bacterium]|nr:diguanylate cyclase [Candidatus Manganitrophaceae bacterium]